jgi:small subunit ribosomal protein S8
MTDPIADMLTRIRNATKARHDRVDMPASNIKVEIARLLKQEGYVANYRLLKDSKQGVLRVFPKYEGGKPVIFGIKRMSKPGRRMYCGKEDLPRIRGGLGITIVSTSKGVLTDAQAKDAGLGGEVLCAVW